MIFRYDRVKARALVLVESVRLSHERERVWVNLNKLSPICEVLINTDRHIMGLPICLLY